MRITIIGAILVCMTPACLSGCERKLTVADVVAWHESQFLTHETCLRVTDLGLSAVPTLIHKMKGASGDITWIPREPEVGEPSPRFWIQWCITKILIEDYEASHPEIQVVAFHTVDNSLDLVRWWDTEGGSIMSGEGYTLPSFMLPYASTEELHSARAKEEQEAIITRTHTEQEAFKKAGYRSINEMLLNTGKVR